MKHNLCILFTAGLFFTMLFAAVSTFGQTVSCPNPKIVHKIHPLSGAMAATPFVADFPTGSCSGGTETNYGGTTINRCFYDTFTFDVPKEMCCQCTKDSRNTLIIKYKVLFGGTGAANNDSWAIYKNGVLLNLGSGSLYSGSVSTGQIFTKTIPIRCEWLSDNRLSFRIQDDTSVISATVNLVACCVTKN